MDFEYCGIMLKWVGDRLYHHTALRNGGEAQQELLGVFASVSCSTRSLRA